MQNSTNFSHIWLWLFASLLLILAVGCGDAQPTANGDEESIKEGIGPASPSFDPNEGMPDIADGAPQLAEIPTPASPSTYDPDGDGFTDTRAMVKSVDDSWQSFEFPPGYQFAIERFHTDFDARAERNDELWEIRYNYTIVSKAQTCSWIQYWLDSQLLGNQDGVKEATRILESVVPENFIYFAMKDYMVSIGQAAALGDISTVQQSIEVLRCNESYFRPDWTGPVGPTPVSFRNVDITM